MLTRIKHREETNRIEGKQGPMLNHLEGKTKRVRVRSDKYIGQNNNSKEKKITNLLREKTNRQEIYIYYRVSKEFDLTARSVSLRCLVHI